MYNKKGTSQAMWIIISVVIALAVAVIILLVVSSSTTKADKRNQDTSDNTNTVIQAQICQERCNTCKQIYGDTCDWSTFGGDCVTKNIMTVC